MRYRCVLILLSASLIGQSRPKQETPTNKENNSAKPNLNVSAQNPPSSVNQKTSSEQQSPKSPLPPWTDPFWPNWALVIITGIAAAIALGTLKDIKKQTVNAKKSADAALLNAKAVINAERPWLLVECEWRKVDKLEGYVFYAINKGKAPAEVIEAHFKPEIIDCIPDDLPLPPPALNAPIQIPRRGDNLIVQSETWEFTPAPIHPESWIDNWMKREDVMNVVAFPYFFGEIVYRDLLRPPSDNEGLHRTRCCFVYDAFLKTIRPTGPSEYREKS